MKNQISWLFIGLLAAFAGAGFLLAVLPTLPILTFTFVLLGWIVSLCLHEYAHAVTALKFGDYTIKDTGYLTLDPRHYFNGPTSIVLPILALVMGGIGLPGGAVMIRTGLIRKKWQQSAVSLAGPAATLVCAALVYAIAIAFNGLPELYIGLMVLFFFLLTAFILNMLPIPGLDGFGALAPYLPAKVRDAVPPQLAGLVTVGLLLLVFFFGGFIIMPIMFGITAALGIDLYPVLVGLQRFKLW
ncbi:hypothetical protein ABAC460_03230 [Asticcacaulis sp. AC460]|uniref:site-2 protease family protein n=1 Tax=Asticcacaulis sp. AC460 TaxID=1282360 RepID=UPI0003C3BD89|nr:site-2 protease family protein [Asticcacaulis sp. AC460]ESQ91923.1 hypothetical protein ABAC460_03230 [Asticcacaulis sp. AC460]